MIHNSFCMTGIFTYQFSLLRTVIGCESGIQTNQNILIEILEYKNMENNEIGNGDNKIIRTKKIEEKKSNIQ